MNKSEFKKRYNISDTPPVDPMKSVVEACVFAEAIAEFTSDNFRGAAEVVSAKISEEYVIVGIEYTAFFLKNLLSTLFGRTYLRIRILEERGALSVTLIGEEPIFLGVAEMNTLIRNARAAGFSFSPHGRGFKMTLPFADAKAIAVYTPQNVIGIRHIVAKLAEICFLSEK